MKGKYFVYERETGKQVGFIHQVDARTALKSGRYLKNPPGVPEPAIPQKVEGEAAVGITIPSDENKDSSVEPSNESEKAVLSKTGKEPKTPKQGTKLTR